MVDNGGQVGVDLVGVLYNVGCKPFWVLGYDGVLVYCVGIVEDMWYL